jgi:hypothetical protein
MVTQQVTQQICKVKSTPGTYLGDRSILRVMLGVFLVAFVALVALVANSPHRFLYDETCFVDYILLLKRDGLTWSFLKNLHAAPGPLCAFVQTIFEPLAKMRPVQMRFVNVCMLILVSLILTAWLRRKRDAYWLAGLSVLTVPMVWLVGGMALSEMSAMVFVTASLYLQLRGLDAFGRGLSAVPWFLAAGFCLGIAVWGRQPYVLICSGAVLVGLIERRLRVSVALFVCVTGCFAVPLFAAWKGLVPPSQHLKPGFALTHALLSFGYTGFCFLLLGARARWLNLWTVITMTLLAMLTSMSFLVNVYTGAFALYPFKSLVDRLLPPTATHLYGSLAGSLILSFGVLSLVTLLRMIWESRRDLQALTILCGLLCVVTAPLFDTHLYSSRYTAMALPFVILAAHPWREWNVRALLLALLGCGLGFLSLNEYFSFAQ